MMSFYIKEIKIIIIIKAKFSRMMIKTNFKIKSNNEKAKVLSIIKDRLITQ